MSQSEPEPRFLSRPVYGNLVARDALMSVMIADTLGADAITSLAKSAPPALLSKAHIIHLTSVAGSEGASALKGLEPESYEEFSTTEAVLERFEQLLGSARMGTQIYLAGSEGLIGRATQVALNAGIEAGAIQCEHRGSLARRVQCVHCKGFTENVTTQPVTCSHCGLLLLVRDHYSRRLAAFQGVCINAEDRSEMPQTEEAFL